MVQHYPLKASPYRTQFNKVINLSGVEKVKDVDLV